MARLLDRLRGAGRARGEPAADPEAPEGSVSASRRWLVVGLGNPGREYEGTRHNIGAEAVRRLAADLGLRLAHKRKLGGHAAEGTDRPGGDPLTLLVPGTYMNRSGGPVQQALAFYGLGLERLVVCHDDLDLPLGAIRLKRGGGDGGHKGLRSIRQRAGGGDFLRVRLGIDRPAGRQDPADYVLKPFAKAERDEVDLAVARAGDAVRDLVAEGLEAAQNRHHAR